LWEVFLVSFRLDVQIFWGWHPRFFPLAVEADVKSKEEDSWDVSLQRWRCERLQQQCGFLFSLEAFARGGPLHNRVWGGAFCSKFHFTESLGKAFFPDWGRYRVWAFPPPRLVPAVVKYAKECMAVGVLIVPQSDDGWWSWIFRRGGDGRWQGQKGFEVLMKVPGALKEGGVVLGPTAGPAAERVPWWWAVKFDFAT
jgi:hypothetical protein